MTLDASFVIGMFSAGYNRDSYNLCKLRNLIRWQFFTFVKLQLRKLCVNEPHGKG